MSATASPLHVLYAPDWRAGVPYQQLLAEALEPLGVNVDYLQHYRRGLPLFRLLRDWRRTHPCDWLHLHWPEAYYPKKNDGLDWFRFLRFPLDLHLATRGLPLAVTAHNLQAHNRRDLFAGRNTRAAFRRARVVFAHSSSASQVLQKDFGVPAAKIRLIPNGNLTAGLGAPLDRQEAREIVHLGGEKVCLMFGAAEPYKGLEEVIDYWREARPACQLHIAGRPCDEAYAASLQARAQHVPQVHLHLGWMTDETLRAWLSAADCALFNYRSIFNSGSAPAARSFGLPLLLPARLHTVELGEPALSVIRFQTFQDDFGLRLHQALSQKPDFEAAAAWREQGSWRRVAQLTAEAYRERRRG